MLHNENSKSSKGKLNYLIKWPLENEIQKNNNLSKNVSDLRKITKAIYLVSITLLNLNSL